MTEPRYEKTEVAQCVGCYALLLYGGLFNLAMVSFNCGITWNGALI